MAANQNDIFKLVSLRKPIQGFTIAPTEDITDSYVLILINEFDDKLRIDPENPDPKIISKLSGINIITEDEIENLTLFKFSEKIEDEKINSFQKLKEATIEYEGEQKPLLYYSKTGKFKNEYKRLTDCWLILRLKKENKELVNHLEVLIRTAHIIFVAGSNPIKSFESDLFNRLKKAKVVFPRDWRLFQYRLEELDKRYGEELQHQRAPDTSKLEGNIIKKREEYDRFKNTIPLLESMQTKALKTFWQWRKAERTDHRIPGITNVSNLDNHFFENFESRLNDDEKLVYENLGERTSGIDFTIDGLLEDYDTGKFIHDANKACAQIKVWEDEIEEHLPSPPDREENEERPAIRLLGYGDLIVAREKLIGYDASEIAHIENVLPGEEKIREHERSKSIEQFTETETIEETVTEKDLQTSDRYELQSQSEKTLQQDFSVDAGWSGSIWGGSAYVNTSFNRNKSESTSSSSSVANEIISKTVERIQNSVRELRRLTITEQIRELNRHSISNLPVGLEPAKAVSGIYKWVEKTHEIELRQYGKRLMIEFHIPEPGITLMERFYRKPEINAKKPAPFNLGPSDVSETNYLCLSRLFGAVDVEPPPQQYIKVGYAWSSAPEESAESKAEATHSEYVQIPDKYIPISGRVSLAIPAIVENDSKKVHLFCAVGGQRIINRWPTISEINDEDEKLIEFFELETPKLWPDKGIPVSILLKGQWDNTAAANISILCMRNLDALTEWKLRTWEKLREAHQILVQEYERVVEEVEFQNINLIEIQSRPSSENRLLERDELKKWAVKTIRYEPDDGNFDFNAVEMAGDFQEIFPPASDRQAPIVNFFESAFEWNQMSYFLYPYFWGRRDAWKLRQQIFDKTDPLHNKFLQAGAAKVIVPVVPGYEKRILHYLESDNPNELGKIKDSDEDVETPEVTSFDDLWMELLKDKKEELAHGLGTLSVTKDNIQVTVNSPMDDEGNVLWEVGESDIGREVFISGDKYYIQSIFENEQKFDLSERYNGITNQNAKYLIGSVLYAQPWQVGIPTSLVILEYNINNLKKKINVN